ncbi:sugar phosphate isomerase/epimerase family protein [Paenibacillus sp. S-38]|uniref:sugar phosphate isomerase/epimerase family protein n=1 Tax=Paenibacillus sp. S-38 TaxID=3416710 RepID=UPI003CF977A0
MSKPGILAHNFGRLPLEELADRVAGAGLASVQLALAKALSDVDSATGKLSPGLANHVGEAFAKRGVRIASLGCYINPVHPDPELRKQELRRFKEHLRFCRDFGASVVATETGKLDTFKADEPDRYEEKAFETLRSSVLELAEEADKWGVTVGIEPAYTLVIHSTEGMLRLLEEVPTSTLGVVLDPCNLLNASLIDRQHEIISAAFDALADRTVLFHAKDIRKTASGGTEYTPLGTGELDYPHFLRLVKERKPHCHITMEGLEPDQIAPSLDFFRKAWNEV